MPTKGKVGKTPTLKNSKAHRNQLIGTSKLTFCHSHRQLPVANRAKVKNTINHVVFTQLPLLHCVRWKRKSNRKRKERQTLIIIIRLSLQFFLSNQTQFNQKLIRLCRQVTVDRLWFSGESRRHWSATATPSAFLVELISTSYKWNRSPTTIVSKAPVSTSSQPIHASRRRQLRHQHSWTQRVSDFQANKCRLSFNDGRLSAMSIQVEIEFSKVKDTSSYCERTLVWNRRLSNFAQFSLFRAESNHLAYMPFCYNLTSSLSRWMDDF